MATGLISTVQPYSTKDGPGIRSTVFCVGCNLRCKWCSNPELMLPGKKVMQFELNGEEEQEAVGYEIDSRSLADTLLRDRTFYEVSGGGVTFSGGEAALQGAFVAETARLLKEQGISTALDTAGDVPWEVLEPLLEYMDLVLYDVKAFDPELHRQCTGRGNEQILSNLERMAQKGQELIIRMVIVPGYNDDLEDVRRRMEFVKHLGTSVQRVDILPYHTLGKGKYKRLGLEYPIEGEDRIEEDYWRRFCVTAKETGIEIRFDGESPVGG